MEAKVCKLIRKDAEEIWSGSGILEMPLMYLWRHIESVTNFQENFRVSADPGSNFRGSTDSGSHNPSYWFH